MSKDKIRAIFFDIDDTLYSTSQFTRQARLDAIHAMIKVGVQMEPDVLFEELTEVVTEFTSNYPYHFDKLLKRIPCKAYNTVNRAIIIASAVIAYHDAKHTRLQAYPDALSLLQKLTEFDIIRGIITAGLEIKQAEKLLRLNIYPYLTPKSIFISDQIGISKPNPKIYKHVCNVLDLKPQEIVYLGDRPLSDIDPANQVGMITVQVLKGGKYSKQQGKTQANYQIESFDELLPKLERDFVLVSE